MSHQLTMQTHSYSHSAASQDAREGPHRKIQHISATNRAAPSYTEIPTPLVASIKPFSACPERLGSLVVGCLTDKSEF